jgi:hypothetical protein
MRLKDFPYILLIGFVGGTVLLVYGIGAVIDFTIKFLSCVKDRNFEVPLSLIFGEKITNKNNRKRNRKNRSTRSNN